MAAKYPPPPLVTIGAPYRLLDQFAALFQGRVYRQRVSTLGNLVAVQLYEDLFAQNLASKFNAHVTAHTCVVNAAGTTHGVNARRGDGKFGANIPHLTPVPLPGFAVLRGAVAAARVAVESKFLCASQVGQIDSRVTDLCDASKSLKAQSANCITVALVAVNYTTTYLNYEGSRTYLENRTPQRAQAESDDACDRMDKRVRPLYDELILLRFEATNQPPYPFRWVNAQTTLNEYGAALARLAQHYQARF